jgi:hypothetical protein
VSVVQGLRRAEVGPEDSRKLLERVVNSQELRRSSRLRDLMLYLGNRSLSSPNASIREQEIGAAVFERPEDYDTNIDNIVRVNVSELRKRLAHYFQEEGAGEELLLEIPRGGYLPVFAWRPVEAAAVPLAAVEEKVEAAAVAQVPAQTEVEAVKPSVRWFVRHAGWIAALVVLLVCAGSLFWQNERLRRQLRPWTADRVTAAFWSQFFASGEEVDIVTADTSYALAQDLLERPISLDDYLDYKYKSFADLPGIPAEKRDALNLVLGRDTGSIGDFDAVERVMELDAHSPALKLASARSFTPESVKNNNVILIGSSESNPWVQLYKDRLNFAIEYDQMAHRSLVRNRAPLAGEPSVYTIVADPDRDYSVIAFLPNLSEHRYALIVAGMSSRGTRAAGEFITSPEGIAAIRERVSAEKYPYFEVLLSSSGIKGTTLHTSILASRGYER